MSAHSPQRRFIYADMALASADLRDNVCLGQIDPINVRTRIKELMHLKPRVRTSDSGARRHNGISQHWQEAYHSTSSRWKTAIPQDLHTGYSEQHCH